MLKAMMIIQVQLCHHALPTNRLTWSMAAPESTSIYHDADEGSMGKLNLRGRVRLSAPMYHKLELAREVEEPKVEEPKVEDHELVRELKEQTKNFSE